MTERSTNRLQIAAYRGGSIAEISEFLSDLETAYLAVYAFERLSLGPWRLPSQYDLLELGSPFLPFGHTGYGSLTMDAVPPKARLTLERVRIESPGFWEFLGALNPLEQIRKYLNDRHERRKDGSYRERLERERMELENEQIRQQIERSKILTRRDYAEFLRHLGYDDDQIRDFIWQQVGPALTRLGRHQDTGLIGGGREGPTRGS